MPVNFLATVAKEGTSVIPYYDQLKFLVPGAAVLSGIKYYFAGPRNTWSRDMHGKVVLITGGTSGLGAVVAKELALSGAQLVLLVRRLDSWTTDYVDDLRELTGSTTIYAEECNLNDFMSVRKFATKWIDNAPPRRLDMVICCAATATPPLVDRQASIDGLEQMLQVNFLAHVHLLNILAPALRGQPPDREVRVVLTTCIASVMGVIDLNDLAMEQTVYDKRMPWRVLGGTKLALALWAQNFQRQFNAYERKDQAPNNVHVVVADPGMMRSPSFKRFFSCGSILGLLIYLVLWPIWWLFLRTSVDGSQSMLHAAMNPEIADFPECVYVGDASIRSTPPRKEFKDQEFQEKLAKSAEELIASAEKQTVIERKRHESAELGNKQSKNKKAKSGLANSKPATTAKSGQSIKGKASDTSPQAKESTGSQTTIPLTVPSSPKAELCPDFKGPPPKDEVLDEVSVKYRSAPKVKASQSLKSKRRV